MVQEPANRSREAAETTDEQQPASAPHGGFLKRLLSPQVLVAVIVLLLLVQGAGIVLHAMSKDSDKKIETEISLGPFSFAPNPMEQSRVTSARFSLHVVPVAGDEPRVREKLETHQYRVQQDLEELMRQAHGGDFADPLLGELKRRIREQVNRTLDMKAVSAVIITDLDIVRNADEPQSPSKSAGTPWAEGHAK